MQLVDKKSLNYNVGFVFHQIFHSSMGNHNIQGRQVSPIRAVPSASDPVPPTSKKGNFFGLRFLLASSFGLRT